MKFPLRIKKTYTTPLTQDEIMDYVRSRSTKSISGLEGIEYFDVDIDQGNFWIIRRPFNQSVGRRRPYKLMISGCVTNENPTKLDLEISPPYFYLLLVALLLSLLVYTVVAMFIVKYNNIETATGSLDYRAVAITGLVVIIWYCLVAHIPILKTERWLVDKLKLTEVKS